MTFPEAEKAYKDLKTQHDAGKLSDAAFEAEVGKLRMQDPQGRWWQIGVQTGEWYMHDGQKWNKAKPPTTATPLSAAEPAAVPEAAGATTIKIAPAPKASAPAKAEPVKKEKEGGAQVQARLFSPKPANSGKSNGLPRGAIIGIIVVVALLGVAILVGGFFFIQAQVTGNVTKALASPTPTRGAILPSPVLPTIPPTVAVSPTPLPPPSPVIAPSPAVTPTTAPVAPTKATGPTAVRKVNTPTPTKPAVSPTPNYPPGVYTMKLETDPAKVNAGDGSKVGFKMTVLNNTGSVQTFKKWFVRVFQCPEQCTGDNAYRASYGESLKFDVNVATGSSVITTPQHMNFGPGRCDYVAVPYYTGENEIATPFLTTKGTPLYQNFSVCN